jgi:hypothetical protein
VQVLADAALRRGAIIKRPSATETERVWATYEAIKAERDRQLAARISSEATGGFAAPSQGERSEDVTMAVPEPVVGPHRPAPTVPLFQP